MVNNKSLNGFNLIQFSFTKLLHEQECIPVRCIPSTAVAAGGGVSQHALGRGVCILACTGQGGRRCVSQHALGRGVSAGLPGSGVCPVGGVVSAQWGCSVCPGRGCLPMGVCLPDTPMNRITDKQV